MRQPDQHRPPAPASARYYNETSDRVVDSSLAISAEGSGLRNITAPRTMINDILLNGSASSTVSIHAWALAIQWTELEPELPKIEMRMHKTANGKEMEIVWTGTLQIADAVNEEYRDHLGSSPLRFPLASVKAQQFFRIRRSR